MNTPLRAAVIGTGRMGRHHARIYSELPQTELVAVVDTDERRAAAVAGEFGGKPLAGIDAVIDSIDVVSIAVPTVHHLDVAKPLIERRIPLLIEKPLAATVAEAQELLDLAQEHDCRVAVGHVERYNPVVRAMRRMKVAPKFIETHRISPFTFRSADIGVVMDMMIHDIDIVLSLVGATEPVRIDAAGIHVLSDHEDIANARVTFADGCVANLTASRLALKTERKIRVFSEEAYLSLDYQKRTGIAIKKDANLDLIKMARERNAEDLSQMQGINFGDLVKVEELAIDATEPLKAEIESFLTWVQTGEPVAVPAREGYAAVQLAQNIIASITHHQWDGTTTGRVGLSDEMLNAQR